MQANEFNPAPGTEVNQRKPGRLFLRIALLFLLFMVPVVAGGAVWSARPQKTAVALEVTGKPGLEIKGTAEVDGTARELTGTVPAEFALEGYHLTYSFTTPEDAGEFRVKALQGGAALGSATSGNPPKNKVRGWVKSNWAWAPPDHWIESSDRDQELRWLRPPP
jgi:hypothetical protein